jgi:hypothetical protein
LNLETPVLSKKASLSVLSMIPTDITESFNFKQLTTKQSLLKQEGIDLGQLKTFEQLFFNNFNRAKASARKFKQALADSKN